MPTSFGVRTATRTDTPCECPADPAWSQTLACAHAFCITGTGRSLVWPLGFALHGPHREEEESKPMTHEREKSDPAIVAGKPANNASVCKTDVAERVERHGEAMRSAWAAGTKGNAGEQSTRRVQDRASVSSSSHFGAPCRANRAAALYPLGSTAPEPSVFCIENRRLRGLGSCAHQAGLGGSPFAKRS